MANDMKLHVDPNALFNPIISACLVNAFYTALLLKKQAGVEVTAEVEEQVRSEVIRLWAATQKGIAESLQKYYQQNPPASGGH